MRNKLFIYLASATFIIITFFVGFNYLSSKYNTVQKSKQIISEKKILSNSDTKCSAKQLYQKNILNSFTKQADDNIASLSSEIKQIEDLTYVKPTKTMEEFQKGIPKPTEANDEFYNRTIQEGYNKYLQKTGEILTKGLANIQKTKEQFTIPKKVQQEKLIKFKNILTPFIAKLKQCENISRPDLQQQLESGGYYNKAGLQKLLILLFETNNEKEILKKSKEFKSLPGTPSATP